MDTNTEPDPGSKVVTENFVVNPPQIYAHQIPQKPSDALSRGSQDSKKSLMSQRSSASRRRRRPSMDDSAKKTSWPDPLKYPPRSLFLFTLANP
eukprot:CAMPEP_0172164354 /NCGR_PEP_ID=MMETSP1050-20130122/7799_1 /TAXON_ID=233186 /ORGANISM="Cryptomonas curvata, Strain CCAP979/52" /LENGTH=93 /DNA_ID=CAMNT_0012834683 /DNA_START=253 /DNA_END=530 /DNA_ORIENTATION=-